MLITVWTNEQRIAIWNIAVRCSLLSGTQENASKMRYVNLGVYILPVPQHSNTIYSIYTSGEVTKYREKPVKKVRAFLANFNKADVNMVDGRH